MNSVRGPCDLASREAVITEASVALECSAPTPVASVRVKTIDTGTELLLAHVSDGVGRIVLNDPARHNTISTDMARALPGAIAAIESDPDVRVIVLRGAGDKAFASGADIGEQNDRATSGVHSGAGSMFEGIGGDVLIRSDKPVVALIRGWCLGGGMLLALCADLRVASTDAQFSIPAAKLGLAAPRQAVEILTANVGPTVAADMLLLGERIDARRALGLGLVNRLVEPDDFDAEVDQLLDALAASAPLSMRAAKKGIAHTVGVAGVDEAMVNDAIADAFASDDAREGTAAFLAKRPPRFTGS